MCSQNFLKFCQSNVNLFLYFNITLCFPISKEICTNCQNTFIWGVRTDLCICVFLCCFIVFFLWHDWWQIQVEDYEDWERERKRAREDREWRKRGRGERKKHKRNISNKQERHGFSFSPFVGDTLTCLQLSRLCLLCFLLFLVVSVRNVLLPFLFCVCCSRGKSRSAFLAQQDKRFTRSLFVSVFSFWFRVGLFFNSLEGVGWFHFDVVLFWVMFWLLLFFFDFIVLWVFVSVFWDLVAWFARMDSHESRESGDLRESEIRVIRANRPDVL